MTETITKIELTAKERREKPRMISASGCGVTCDVAVTFPLLIAQSKAAEIERLYLANPAPQVELTAWLGSTTKWIGIGKFIGIEKHSVSSLGNSVWDVMFEPDDKSTLQIFKLRAQQAR